jgi:uncharacterized protein (UPF0303 family)
MTNNKGKLIKLIKDENESVQVFKYNYDDDCYNIITDIRNQSIENKLCILLEKDNENPSFYNCLIDNCLYLVNIKNVSFDV